MYKYFTSFTCTRQQEPSKKNKIHSEEGIHSMRCVWTELLEYLNTIWMELIRRIRPFLPDLAGAPDELVLSVIFQHDAEIIIPAYANSATSTKLWVHATTKNGSGVIKLMYLIDECPLFVNGKAAKQLEFIRQNWKDSWICKRTVLAFVSPFIYLEPVLFFAAFSFVICGRLWKRSVHHRTGQEKKRTSTRKKGGSEDNCWRPSFFRCWHFCFVVFTVFVVELRTMQHTCFNVYLSNRRDCPLRGHFQFIYPVTHSTCVNCCENCVIPGQIIHSRAIDFIWNTNKIETQTITHNYTNYIRCIPFVSVRQWSLRQIVTTVFHHCSKLSLAILWM